MTVVIDRTSPSPRTPVSAAAAARARAGRTSNGGLYKPRVPIYPKEAHGRWRQIKWTVLVAALAVYYITPWLRWNRPGDLPDQAVLVDFFGSRFYFFGLQLWPQEIHFVAGLLVMAALALFLATALFGRLWCGYACPQTVWTDLYIFVERLFEGDRNARMRLAAAPWSPGKLWRKAGKHAVWLAVAFGTGGAWIFYFRDAPLLLREFWTGAAPITSYVSCALLTATTYVFAGHMREQVCIYMCPWPRIQGAMLDQHSLQVTYRYDRGEPRGAHKKTESWEGRGDCIDCHACVVVCPMGIDIRDGAQLECINCGLCIDACDEVMPKVGRPTGLIAYDTDAAVEARSKGGKPIYRLLRPRTLYYTVALVAIGGLMAWGLTHRAMVELHALRDRNPTYVRLHDGQVRNGYTLKIANRAFEARTFEVRLEGPSGAVLRSPGEPSGPVVRAIVPANEVRAFRVFVTAPVTGVAAASLPAAFRIRDARETAVARTVFLTGVETAQ